MHRLIPRSLFLQGVLLFLLAMSGRLVYLFGLNKVSDSSNVEVEKAAVKWASDGELADAFGDGTGPTAHVPPLYTGLVASLHCVFGVKSQAALTAQRLLSTAVCSLGIALLPWLAFRSGLSYPAGVVAAIGLALYPFHVFIETYGRQETVYGVLLSMYLFLTWLRLRDTGWMHRRDVLLFAFLTGLAALTSPQLILLTGLALLFDFATRPGERRRVFESGVIVALVGAVMIAPWVYRNHIALGGFVPLRSNFGLELFIGNNPDADGHTYTIPYAHPGDRFAWPHPFNHPGERQRVRDLGELAYMREKGDMAKEWIRAHPAQFAGLTLRRVSLYWFPPISTWNPKLSAKWPRSAAAWLLSATCLCGLFLVFRHRHPNRWPLLIVLVAPSLVYLLTHVNVRYRYSTVWTMALLAGYAVMCLSRRLRRGEEPAPSRTRLLYLRPALAPSAQEKVIS